MPSAMFQNMQGAAQPGHISGVAMHRKEIGMVPEGKGEKHLNQYLDKSMHSVKSFVETSQRTRASASTSV